MIIIVLQVHIPRGLGISSILYGICGIICTLPYFIQDHSTYDIEQKPNTPDIPNNITAGGGKVPMCVNGTLNGNNDGCGVGATGVAESMTDIQQLRIKKVAYCIIAVGMVRACLINRIKCDLNINKATDIAITPICHLIRTEPHCVGLLYFKYYHIEALKLECYHITYFVSVRH